MYPRAEQCLCLGVWVLALSPEKAQGEVLEAVGDARLAGHSLSTASILPCPGGSLAWTWLQAAAGSHGSAESLGNFLLLILPAVPAPGGTLK